MRPPAAAALPLSALAILFVAGIVHIVSIMALPELASRDAYSRLAATVAPGKAVLLPPALPGHELAPYSDPAMVQAVCLYDVSQQPLRVRARLDGGGFLSLSFRTRGGRVFYAMTDAAAVRGEIDIVVMTQAALEAAEAEDDADAPPPELRLVSQTATGFVMIQALAAHPLDRPDAEARVTSVTCAPEADDAE